jgi:hypothetical protein
MVCLFVCLFVFSFFSFQKSGERELYQLRVAELLKENESLRAKIAEMETANKRLKTSVDLHIHKF